MGCQGFSRAFIWFLRLINSYCTALSPLTWDMGADPLWELQCIPEPTSCPTFSRHLYKGIGGVGEGWGCQGPPTSRAVFYLKFRCRRADIRLLHNLSPSCNWKQGYMTSDLAPLKEKHTSQKNTCRWEKDNKPWVRVLNTCLSDKLQPELLRQCGADFLRHFRRHWGRFIEKKTDVCPVQVHTTPVKVWQT